MVPRSVAKARLFTLQHIISRLQNALLQLKDAELIITKEAANENNNTFIILLQECTKVVHMSSAIRYYLIITAE